MARLVRVRLVDDIAVVTMDAPPVNALSAQLRAALWEVFARIEAQSDIHAAILMAGGGMYSAGADIGEFAAQPKRPSLPELCNRIEACSKPVVAAIHGKALGGGAEIAMACHYRVASTSAEIGLPEVTLGLIPGAGGTQRLPRLVGAATALHMMVSANSVPGTVAARLGLVDRVVDEDLSQAALTFTRNLLRDGHGPRPTRNMRKHLQNGREQVAAVAQIRKALAGNPLHAPQRVVDCVEAAGLLPFDAGLAFEEDAFARCFKHPQSIALRHVFRAERRIDSALIAREGNGFKPVAPMGKAAVQRLREAMHRAAQYLVENEGVRRSQVDGAMVAYGMRKGPFGGHEAGAPDTSILRRILAAILAEGAACVEQGAVQRPCDIDALAVHGMGFPRREGGPFRAAQTMGLIGLRNDMRVWAQQDDCWAVPNAVEEAIKDARGFDLMNEAG